MEERKSFLVRHFGLRGIAVFEALKGVLALLIGIWVLTLMHKDMEAVAARMLDALHLNPGGHFSGRVIHFAERLTDRNLWIFIFGVIVYALIRFVEAAGLWLEKEWAEWFALLSGSMYLPWEIYEIARRPNWLRWTIFGINVVIVLYLLWLRIEMHRIRKHRRLQQSPPDPT